MLEPVQMWRNKGKCAGILRDEYMFSESSAKTKEGKKFCTGCPVMDQCRTYAIAHDEVGVWGGTSRAERRALGPDITKIIQFEFYRHRLLEYRPGFGSLFHELEEKLRLDENRSADSDSDLPKSA